MARKELDHGLIEVARGLQNTPWCDEYERMISGMMSVAPSTPSPSLSPSLSYRPARDNGLLTRNGRPGTIL